MSCFPFKMFMVTVNSQADLDAVLKALSSVNLLPESGGVALGDIYDPQCYALMIGSTGLITMVFREDIERETGYLCREQVVDVAGFLAMPLDAMADSIMTNRAKKQRKRDAESLMAEIKRQIDDGADVSCATLDALHAVRQTLSKS